MTKKLLFLFVTICTCSVALAQISKPFGLAAPADDATIVLQGNKSTEYPMTWTSGKGPQTAGANYDYSLFFDSIGGDISAPIDNITKNCCASSFQDTILHFDGNQWASFLNGVSQKLYSKDFEIGDTLSLIWKVNLAAVGAGPVYEFQQSQGTFVIHFVRGQFNDEYVPVNLKNPSNFKQTFIQGNPNQTVLFEWTSAYCPSACGAASYDLMIDTVDGDFSTPYYTISVPNNDSSWEVSFNTFNQLLIDTKTGENASRQVFWRVLAYGNSQVMYSTETRVINLWNGLLDNENSPFSLLNPVNNSIFSLSGTASTQLNFKWQTTTTAKGPAEKYFLVFDTAFASPIFANPIALFQTGNNSSDTAINLTYGQIDHLLDSLYPSWKSANLMWGIKAQAQGTYYYPETPHFIEFISGVLSSTPSVSSEPIGLYPNPAKSYFQLASSSSLRSLTIYTTQGKQVHNETLASGETQVDCRELPNGLYLVVLQEGSIQKTQLLSIQH